MSRPTLVLAALLWLPAAAGAEDADGFAWNRMGWAALDQGRRKEARGAFAQALDRAATPAAQAEARLGLALTALSDGKPAEALPLLRAAAVDGPYAVAAAQQLAGEASLALGDRPGARTYLRQALDVDPANLEVLRGLMRASRALGDRRAAWLAAVRLLSFDPADEEARDELRRDASAVRGDPAQAAGTRRLPRPLLNPDGPAPSSPGRPLAVGLYGAPDGRPALMSRAGVMPNANFSAVAADGAVLREGIRGQAWSLEFRAETGAVEARDAGRAVLFASTQPFRLLAGSPNGSVLIQEARLLDPVGVDEGDREHRGALLVLPDGRGLRLVAETPLERYLYGAVAMALPEGSPAEAYRAQAVVARTAAAWAAAHRPQGQAWDILDDAEVQRTLGLSGEMSIAAEAAAATSGLVLARAGAAADVAQHEASGGLTEEGVLDAASPFAPPRTGEEIERFAREAPPGLYSASAPAVLPAAARWIRVLDARGLSERLKRRRDVGALRDVRVVERAPSGRVRSLLAAGSRGEEVFTGPREIAALLSPGSLRSTFFALQPLREGKTLSRLLVWGAGTGSGEGLSRADLSGRVALGASWQDALKAYFPGLELVPLDSLNPPAPKK